MTVISAVLLLCVLCTGLFFWYRHRMLNRIIGHQPMRIMVDGNLLYNYGDTLQKKPDSLADGTITEIIGTASFPKKDGQANFGVVGMPYWHLEDKIVVEYEKFYLFGQS